MIFAFISVSISILQVHVKIASDKETKTKTNPENKTLIKKRCKNQIDMKSYEDTPTPLSPQPSTPLTS